MAGDARSADRMLIAGGGIGGLAAALTLAAHGRRSHVLEQSSRFGEIGAGIQLAPNAFKMLDRMGIADAVRAVTFLPESLIMRDAVTGDEVTRIPVGGDLYRQRYTYPYGVIYRADLHRLLLDACKASPLIELSTGRKVTGYRDTGSSVVATLASGETVEGAALIGADGLWSSVRAQMLNDGPPRVSGHIAYRAVLPIADVPVQWRANSVVLWGGAKHHLVHYPLRHGDIFNLVAVFHSNRYEEGWDTYGDPAELERFFEGSHPQVMGLLAKIDAWKMWVLCDREPVKHWSSGRVTLLGDAAHPMLQYLAQGACMAIEDAVVLADSLAAASDVAAAFTAYEAARYLRTARVQLTARFYGDFYHAGGVAAEVRNALFGKRTPQQALEGMAWLYDGI